MRGKTTVLAGPSGVGKSTLTNAIHPQAAMETGDISRKIERGKHTTRHSELFFLEEDTYMMDTPGFSSIFPPDMEAGELKAYFPEFAPYEADCRFAGCVHVGERDCGVKEALDQGLAAIRASTASSLQISRIIPSSPRNPALRPFFPA